MLAPKVLLFLGEVPRDVWPEGAEELRAECVRVLRERQLFRCLPEGYREFGEVAYHTPLAERPELRRRWIAEHGPPEYEPALGAVRSAADPQMRWIQRTSFDDKMLAPVGGKGKPSTWLTLRALEVLGRFGG